MTDDGRLQGFVNVFIDDTECRRLGLAASVSAGTVVSIVPAVAGRVMRRSWLRIGVGVDLVAVRECQRPEPGPPEERWRRPFNSTSRPAVAKQAWTARRRRSCHPRPEGQRRARQEVGAPITNDGVSIAKEIELRGSVERIGAELVKEIAKKTDDVAGRHHHRHRPPRGRWSRSAQCGRRRQPDVAQEGHRGRVEAAVGSIRDNSQDVSRTRTRSPTSPPSRLPTPRSVPRSRGDRQDRQGRRDHGRGRPDLRSRSVVEGMRFDKGYISPYSVTDAERMDRARQPLHPFRGGQDQQRP